MNELDRKKSPENPEFPPVVSMKIFPLIFSHLQATSCTLSGFHSLSFLLSLWKENENSPVRELVGYKKDVWNFAFQFRLKFRVVQKGKKTGDELEEPEEWAWNRFLCILSRENKKKRV